MMTLAPSAPEYEWEQIDYILSTPAIMTTSDEQSILAIAHPCPAGHHEPRQKEEVNTQILFQLHSRKVSL